MRIITIYLHRLRACLHAVCQTLAHIVQQHPALMLFHDRSSAPRRAKPKAQHQQSFDLSSDDE